MNVSLTPELEKMVGEKVKSGLYNSASEVVRESLRLLKEQDDFKARRLEELRQEVRAGMAQLEAGEAVTYSSPQALMKEVKARGRTALAAHRSSSTS